MARRLWGATKATATVTVAAGYSRIRPEEGGLAGVGDMDDAGLYEHANFLQRRDAEAILREISPQMHWSQDEEEELILDVGCGAGDVTNDILSPLVDNCVADGVPDNGRAEVGGSSGSGSGGNSGNGSSGSSGSGSGGGGGGGGSSKSRKNSSTKQRRKSQVVGVDISREMIEHARERSVKERERQYSDLFKLGF